MLFCTVREKRHKYVIRSACASHSYRKRTRAPTSCERAQAMPSRALKHTSSSLVSSRHLSNLCNRLLSRSNCNLNLQVHVFCLVRPQVSLVMPRGYPYYSADFYHTLTCRYRGDPAPTIQWQWQPCNTVRCLPTGNWTQTKYTSRDIYQRDVSFDRIFCSYSNKFTCASMRH